MTTTYAEPAADAVASGRFLAGTVVTGLVAAVLVPDYPPGVGLTISLLLIGATLLPDVRDRLDRWGWSMTFAIGVLALMPTLRAAEWLVALDVLAVGALGSLVLARARSGSDVLLGLVGVGLRAPQGAGLLVSTAASVAGRPAAARQLRPLVRGVLLSVVVLGVFGALFISADSAFADLAARFFPNWTVDVLVARIFTFGAVVLALSAGLAVSRRPVRSAAGAKRPTVGRLEWLLPIVALDVLFAAFVAVQLAVLFGGDDYVQRTTGLSYASYAREGFSQLLFVVVLTLGVIAAAVRRVGPEPRERNIARAALGVLCLLTAVVLVSAMHRLDLYEDAFGLTRLRVLACTVGLLTGAVLVLVVIAGARWSGSWLPRAVVATTAITLIGLNIANPDQLIARRAVDRARTSGRADTAYLAGLSADAVPDLLRLPTALRSCVVVDLADVPDGAWPGANYARHRARAELREAREATVVGPEECPESRYF